MLAITQRTFGGPEVLEAVDIDPPTPRPTEVLVRVAAIGVNPVERVVRSGARPILGTPPFTLGWEVSGVVERAVPGYGRFRVGDEVFGMPFFPRQAAGYAGYVAAPARMFARKPSTVDHVHAAAVPLAGLTAWQGLVDYADVRSGQKVLVHGAAGGVGHLAVQIAKAQGAYVVGTASARRHDFVRGLGADEVIDYTALDFATVVHDVDVVLETVGGDTPRRSLATLRPGGTLVTIVDHFDAGLAAEVEAAGHRFVGVCVEPDGHALGELARLVDAGLLRPHVGHVLPLADVSTAHELLAAGHLQGKIVLTT